MAGVFVLSALIGGGIAGLFLAMQGTIPTTPDEAGGSAISVIAKMPADGGQGSTGASQRAGEVNIKAKPRDRLQQDNAVAIAPSAANPETVTPKQAARQKTESRTPASTRNASVAGAEELQQLTEQVISALGALGRAERQGSAEAAAEGAENLRNSLAALVDAAVSGGKSNAEIQALVQEALGNLGEQNLPTVLLNADGKVDVQRLLASIVPAMQPDMIPMDSEERSYFDQLQAEANITSTREQRRQPTASRANAGAARKARTAGNREARTRQPRASGRFFVRNGKRYTVIRRGDTLSDIAFAAYGDVLAYPAILRANRGRISTRNLKPGTRILIPDIATSRKPPKTRKRRSRRQSATTPAARKAVRTVRKSSADRKSNRQGGIISLPAAGQPQKLVKPVKITNFRSSRESAGQQPTAAGQPLALPSGSNAPQQ